MVEIDHANEPFERFGISRLGIILDGFDLGWQRCNPVLGDSMSQEINFGNSELAFFQLND